MVYGFRHVVFTCLVQQITECLMLGIPLVTRISQMLEELNGIFAFALYDAERDEFLIAQLFLRKKQFLIH